MNSISNNDIPGLNSTYVPTMENIQIGSNAIQFVMLLQLYFETQGTIQQIIDSSLTSIVYGALKTCSNILGTPSVSIESNPYSNVFNNDQTAENFKISPKTTTSLTTSTVSIKKTTTVTTTTSTTTPTTSSSVITTTTITIMTTIITTETTTTTTNTTTTKVTTLTNALNRTYYICRTNYIRRLLIVPYRQW